MLPTPDDIQRSARARVEKDFIGACLDADTWLTLLVRHATASAAAAQITVDEIDENIRSVQSKHADAGIEDANSPLPVTFRLQCLKH